MPVCYFTLMKWFKSYRITGPVCHFYKLINMRSRGDAQSIVDAMVNQFKLDNIWSIMKSRLKAITFDGANVSENIKLLSFNSFETYCHKSIAKTKIDINSNLRQWTY